MFPRPDGFFSGEWLVFCGKAKPGSARVVPSSNSLKVVAACVACELVCDAVDQYQSYFSELSI